MFAENSKSMSSARRLLSAIIVGSGLILSTGNAAQASILDVPADQGSEATGEVHQDQGTAEQQAPEQESNEQGLSGPHFTASPLP